MSVLVVGAFLGGGTQDAVAADYYINYLEIDGSQHNNTTPWDGGWVWSNSYSAYNPGYDHTFSNGLINAINLAGATTGNQVLVTTTYEETSAANPGNNAYRYRSQWGSTATAGGTINIANAVNLDNQRGGTYTITNITKNGTGVLTMTDGTYNNTNFTGSAGGITLAGNAGLTTSGQADVGGATGFTFNTGGRTWTVQGGLIAHNTFTKAGGGTLDVTGYSDIIGNSSLTGGTWSSSTGIRIGRNNNTAGTGSLSVSSGAILTANALTVGDLGAGSLTNGGTMTSTTSNIGLSNTGTVTNNGSWTGSGAARIGVGGVGTVTNNNSWTNQGQVTVGGTGSTFSGTVTNMGTMNWTNSNPTLIGQVGSGHVINGYNSATGITNVNAVWNNTGQMIVGAGTGGGVVDNYGLTTWSSTDTTLIGREGNGTVNQHSGTLTTTAADVWVGAGGAGTGTVRISGGTWEAGNSATGREFRVGATTTGYVYQSGGTWNNRYTHVGVGAAGYVDQSGGTHNDQNADIGDTNYGRYLLHNANTIWNTANGATIGVTRHNNTSNGYHGYASVYDGATWNVNNSTTTPTDHLIVGNLGNGLLEIYNNGTVNVKNTANVSVGKLYDNVANAGSNSTVNISSGGGMNVSGNTNGTGNTTGHMYISEDRGTTGTVNVSGSSTARGSFLSVAGDLITGQDNGGGLATGFSQGNLYAWDGASINVGRDHTIADGVNALGRDYIDGADTTMYVAGTLTVGNEGQAGGTYTENRYDPRYTGSPNDPANGDWLGDTYSRTPFGTSGNAIGATWTGNSPGLAITRGATVTSAVGRIGVEAGSNGYVVIDNAGNYNTPSLASIGWNDLYNPENNTPVYTDNSFYDDGTLAPGLGGINGFTPIGNRSISHTVGNRTTFASTTSTSQKPSSSSWDVAGLLTVGEEGNAFLRVLNGGVLRTGLTTATNGVSTIIGSGSDGVGSLYVYGGFNGAWGRSVWQSHGATIVGAGDDSETMIRINDGALGETRGLYIGTGTDSDATVSVMGYGSTLHILENTGLSGTYANLDYNANPLALSGLGNFSASENALIWMDANSQLRHNGMGVISTGSVLHLNGKKDGTTNPVYDAGHYMVNFVNSRLEGIGLVTAEHGVNFIQCDAYTGGGQACIDPGLVYGWKTQCEKDYYGTLVFGHTLNIGEGVITYFDVNSGYAPGATRPSWVPAGNATGAEQDWIIVQADPNNLANHGDQVSASLGGTLMLHARLTENYYKDYQEYEVVRVKGDPAAGDGKGHIYDPFDELHIVPERFFTGVSQDVRMDGDDDVLYVTMALHQTPFESSANTYNERSVGRALDQIYANARATDDLVWLPFLRQFWNIADDDQAFSDALRLYSGEIRAHSMLMPIQNPWTYAHERNGFSRCTDHVIFGPQNRSCNITSGRNLWGTYIHTENSTHSDGNAGEYDLRRNGFAVGYERASQGGHSYLGAMFAFNQGKLNAWESNAKSDDFQFGLYHGKKAWDKWEWKNFLGMGIQNYKMNRNISMSLNTLNYTGGTASVCESINAVGDMTSNFAGLTMAGSTELARPFYFGKCCQWTLKPYMGLDLMATWQNSAWEDGDLTIHIDGVDTGMDAVYPVGNTDYYFSDLVALHYHSATNVRLYGRPGIMLERGGSNGNLRMGVSYSYLMGGRRYTNVNNQFQYGGEKFNLRGVDDGSGFVTANVGAAAYIGKRKLSMVYIDYAVLAGSHSTTQAAQLGFQRNF